ncbi:MAG: DUF2079 domain-containing protein [Anaerolineae bacterium]|nr:DUF2079 domain-containing protein [Anaerolineae bacterium]MDW8098669.1 DUF2079 domain-containing protein [Anaerolineae bacterium]
MATQAVKSLIVFRKWGLLLTILATLAFAIYFGALSVARHEAFQTAGYDLGNADQALWNTAHGRPLRFTNWVGKDNWFREPTRLGMHVEPIYFLLVPLYWLWEDVRALLILQAAAVALGAIPAYRLARRRLYSEAAGASLALAYLAHPGLHSLVTSDFHAVALAAPLLLAAFDFVEEKRNGPFALVATLAMATKENIPLAVAGLGVWAWLMQKRRCFGIVVVLLALAWFTIATFVIIPAYNIVGRSPYLSRYQAAMSRAAASHMLANLTDHVARRYYLNYLLPLAGLPLLNLPALIPAIPELAINLLSSDRQMRTFGRQYVAALIPIATAAAALGLATLWGWTQLRRPTWLKPAQTATLGLLLLASAWSSSRSPWMPFAADFQWPRPTSHQRGLAEFARLIPDDASLCTQDNLNPHFTHRSTIHLLPYSLDCEYALLDVKSYPGNNYGDIQTYLRQRLLESGDFGLIAADDGYVLFQRGAPRRPLPDSFYRFALPEDVNPDIRMSGRFGDVIRFLGYEVDPRSGQAPHLSLYFEALRPLQEDYRLILYLVEEPGTLIAATEFPQPALVWYPTSLWQPGRIVEVRANTIDWLLEPGKVYAMALGWIRGPNVWDPSTRLPYIGEDGDLVPRRFQGDTLVYLASFTASGEVTIATRRDKLPDQAQPIRARLANGVVLAGFALENGQGRVQVHPGETLHLRLFWQVEATPDRDYTVFVHLLDSSGQLAGQGDSPPLGNSWPTSRWRPGDLVPDLYAINLAPTLSPGLYRICLGMYDPDSGKRVDIAGEGVDQAMQAIYLPVQVQVVL